MQGELEWGRRIAECVGLGLHYDFRAGSYVKDGFNIAMVEIKTLGDAEWAALLLEVKEKMQWQRKNL